MVFLPKGGGAENKSTLTMLRPADGEEGVVATVLETAKKAGERVVRHGYWELALADLSILSLLLQKKHCFSISTLYTKNTHYTALEEKITKGVNALHIGTMGLVESQQFSPQELNMRQHTWHRYRLQ